MNKKVSLSFVDFTKAIFNNQLDTLSGLNEAYHPSVEFVRRDQNYCIRKATQLGHYPIVTFLADTFPLEKKDVFEHAFSAMTQALIFGEIEILNFFVDRFRISSEDMEPYGVQPLRHALSGVNRDISARWLKEQGFISPDMVRGEGNTLLKYFVELGEPESVRLLHDICGLTDQDARLLSNYPLRLSAERGDVNTLVVLKEVYGLTYDDAISEGQYALREASAHGQIDALAYLKTGFGLSARDAASIQDTLIQDAIQNGRVDTLRCLKELFELTITKHDIKQAQAQHNKKQRFDFAEFKDEMAEKAQDFMSCGNLDFEHLEKEFGRSVSYSKCVTFWNHCLASNFTNSQKQTEVGRFCTRVSASLKEGKLTFDLHGLRRRSALAFMFWLMATVQHYPPLQKGLIALNVGRGLHSTTKSGEPVLANWLPGVLEYLSVTHTLDGSNVCIPAYSLHMEDWTAIDAIK